MEINQFFQHYVEGYLFGDLKSMSEKNADKRTGNGGLGYSMMQTTLAGIELLGNLLLDSGEPFKATGSAGRDYFINYWDKYLSRQFPIYEKLGDLFYYLLRCGIAHTFLTKQGIQVSKSKVTSLRIDPNNRIIRVDCVLFYKDFEKTYNYLVKPILNDDSKESILIRKRIQIRINSLLSEYEKNSKKQFDNYMKYFESLKSIDSSRPLVRNLNINSYTTYSGTRPVFKEDLRRASGSSTLPHSTEIANPEQYSV